MLIPASRAASLHSASSADMMLAEGWLDMPPYDVEAGHGVQPLVTPSGMGVEFRCAEFFHHPVCPHYLPLPKMPCKRNTDF